MSYFAVDLKVDLSAKWVVDLLSEPRVLRIATVGRNNQPHISSVWFIFRDGKFIVSTARDRLKAKDVAANPKVVLIVDTDTAPYRGIIVWGEARLVDDSVAETTREIVAKYVPADRVEQEFEELMRADRVLMVITPKKVIDIMSYRERRRQVSLDQ